jgi:hypothetical protein
LSFAHPRLGGVTPYLQASAWVIGVNVEAIAVAAALVAALGRNASGALSLYKNTLDASGSWGIGGAVATMQRNVSVIEMCSGGATIYIAYNAISGGSWAAKAGVQLTTHKQLSQSKLQAAAFFGTTDDAQIYAVFESSPYTVCTMLWSVGGEGTDELFLPSAISSLHVYKAPESGWMFAANAADGPLVADSVRRTFTAMQGMPKDTLPYLIAPSNGEWAAASDREIFLIDPAQCAVGYYWDGTRCVKAMCVRTRPCAASGC